MCIRPGVFLRVKKQKVFKDGEEERVVEYLAKAYKAEIKRVEEYKFRLWFELPKSELYRGIRFELEFVVSANFKQVPPRSVRLVSPRPGLLYHPNINFLG